MTLKLRAEDDPFEHIHPDVRHLALAETPVRKATIEQDWWVAYPAGDDTIARLFGMADTPPRTRMPAMLFWAGSNMGKTSIQKRFLALFAARCERTPTRSAQSVLWMEINAELNEKRLYLDLLRAMKAPTPERATTSRLQRMVLSHLEARQVRLFIPDELQRVADLRSYEARVVMNALRYLCSQQSMCIAAFGSGETKALIQADPHLKERFEIVALPAWTRREKWAVDTVRERIAYMPIRKPTIVDRAFMDALMTYSDELVGRMFSLLEQAGVAALNHEECISAGLIEAVAQRRRRAEDG